MSNQNTNQKNPNNDEFWQLKGYPKRPNDYKELHKEPSKRQKNKKKHGRLLDDGRGDGIDSMFDPLSKDDY